MRADSRRLWLCADDYGMAPGVNRAIRELIARGRLNATSVMMPVRHIGGEEAAALDTLNAGATRAALGLHVTLTGHFKPLSDGFAPLRDGHFLTIGQMLRAAVAGRLDAERLTIEIATQMEAFMTAFGRPPDFVDGHQHVQLLPQVRSAFLKVVRDAAPKAWVRQCGRAPSALHLQGVKGLSIDVLNLGFRSAAERMGIATNPAFAGVYDFASKAEFAMIFLRFLAGLPDGGLIMCHPGFVDSELKAVDKLTQPREREFAFFNSDAFPALLARQGVALARPAGNGGSAA